MFNKNHLIALAFCSRCFFFCLQTSSNYFLEDFDSSTWLTVNQSSTNIFLNGLNKWDSVYFIYIAQRGYAYEQMLAFYPGFPYVVWLLVHVFQWIFAIDEIFLLTQLVAVVLNTFCFVLASVVLYQLTMLLTENHAFAIISSLLFIINPANIFMLSAYTECQFVCLQFITMYCLERKKYLSAICLVIFTMLTRSNGVLNVVIFMYFYMKRELACKAVEVTGNKNAFALLLPNNFSTFICNFSTLKKIFLLLIYICAPVAVYVLHQWIIYQTYCQASHISLLTTHWCKNLLPLSYSYIQQHYWNVGFLKYWEINQLPNFLLATPIIYIVFEEMRSFLSSDSCHDIILSLGFSKCLKKNKDNLKAISYSQMFIYLFHAFVLTILGIFIFHVQILTRMICSSTPLVYWACARVIMKKRSSYLSSLILGYFLSFGIIGTILHCNFYPWT